MFEIFSQLIWLCFAGQTCGGKGYVVGRCAKGLKCNLASASYQHPVGICISLIKPTSQPAQKLLIDRPINGGENFPRQDIPGSNHRKEGNDLPGDDAKYYVHPNGMWSIHTVKIQDDIAASKVEPNAMNSTGNKTHDQALHKKSTKGNNHVHECKSLLGSGCWPFKVGTFKITLANDVKENQRENFTLKRYLTFTVTHAKLKRLLYPKQEK